MRFRRGRIRFLLFATMLLATFWGIRATHAGTYLSSPHGDATNGVNRDAAYTAGHCAHCHGPHSGITGGYNLVFEGNAMCFNNGGGSCHNSQPTTYPCAESDRLPSTNSANHYYFEKNTAGTKTTGVDNRCRWPGSTEYTDTGTDATSGTYYSPHFMDVDMPKKDSSNYGLCTNCHNPHGVASPQLDMLLNTYTTPGSTANYNICFSVTTSGGTTYTCHDTGGVPSTPANTLIKGFYDQADNQAGHQIRGSTKSISGSLPTGISVGDKMPCYNCHDPHGSEGSRGLGGADRNTFLISDQTERGWYGINDTLNTAADVRAFCAGFPTSTAGVGGCHVYSNGGAATKTVMGISMKAIPALGGNDHESTDTASCYGCHGKSYTAASDNNVHHPGAGGECKTCHAAAQGTGGYRRRIVGPTSGDIGSDNTPTMASWHVNATSGALNSGDCEDCHEQTLHMSITDPGVRLYDPDNGATVYSYTGTATQLDSFCANCHDSGGAARFSNPTTPFSNSGDSTTVPDIKTFWTATYNHDFATPGDGADAGCMHCHGNSGNNDTTQNPRINAHGSTADKILTDGVNPTNSTAGAAPTSYTLGTIASPGSGCGGTCTDLDVQYRICFKCHSDWSSAPTWTGKRNLAISLNPANDSYHWVEGDKGSGPKASTTYGNFNSTYIQTMMPGRASYTDASLRTASLKCSDCHGGSGVTSTSPQGPHGSSYNYILKVPSGSPYTTWSSTVYCNGNGSVCSATNVWCWNCHDPDFVNTGWYGSGVGNLHVESFHSGTSATCQTCHLRVPHGSGLNDAGTALVGTAAQRKRLLKPTTFTDGVDSIASGSYTENHTVVSLGCT